MKILIVVDGIWPPLVRMTGMSTIYSLQKALTKKNLEIHILTTIEKHTDPSWRKWFAKEEQKGVYFHFLNLGPLKELRQIHFFLFKLVLFFMVLILQFRHDFDIIHEYSSSPLLILRTGLYKLIFKKVNTLHTLCTYNANFEKHSKLIKRGFLPDKIVCTNYHMLRILRSTTGLENKIIYLPLGIKLSRFKNVFNKTLVERKKELDLPLNNEVVLYVGLIDKRKGIFDLVQAAPIIIKENPDILFLIVSFPLSGVLYDYSKNKKKIIKIIEDNHTREKFLFLEGLYDIPKLMSIADVCVFPITTMHGILGYPLTLLEAMALGKGVVASDIEIIKEIVSHEKNGLLFCRGDIRNLSQKVNLLLSNKKLKNKFGRCARKEVKKFELDNIAQDLKKVYFSLGNLK